MSKKSRVATRSTLLDIDCGGCAWDYDNEIGAWYISVPCNTVPGHTCFCPSRPIDPSAAAAALNLTCYEYHGSPPAIVGEEQTPIDDSGQLTNLNVAFGIADGDVPGGTMNFGMVAPYGREFVNVRTADERFQFLGNLSVVGRPDFALRRTPPDPKYHDFVAIYYPQYDKTAAEWVWKTGYFSFNASRWYSQKYFTLTLTFPNGTKFYVELLAQIRQI